MTARSTACWDFILCIPLEELPTFGRTYCFQSFNTENGGDSFLQNVGKLYQNALLPIPDESNLSYYTMF
jgi:hypothetical protein